MRKVILIATVALLGTAWSMLNSQPTQESTCERNKVEALSEDEELPEVEVLCDKTPTPAEARKCWNEVYIRVLGEPTFAGCELRHPTDYCCGERYEPKPGDERVHIL